MIGKKFNHVHVEFTYCVYVIASLSLMDSVTYKKIAPCAALQADKEIIRGALN